MGTLRALGEMVSPDRRATLGDRLAAMDADEAAHLVALARAHGVEAWLAGSAPDGEAWASLAEQRQRFVAVGVRGLAELRAIGTVLDAIDCPWAVLKGRALAEDVYPQPYLRYGIDDDVLVPPSRFADAIAALTAQGWTLLDRNWPLIREIVPGELRLRSPRGRLLDLHWHLLDLPELRRSFAMPTGPLLARRRPLGSGLPALDPLDQLIHVVVHAALSGATRLSWLLDTSLSVRAVPDWEQALQAVRGARAIPPLALVLARARRWLATPLPDGGGSPPWRAVCRIVDLASPPSARPDAPSLARSFARCARPSIFRSVEELARHGSAWLGAGRPRTPEMAANRDPADPRSPLHDVDDAVARGDYLAIVGAS